MAVGGDFQAERKNRVEIGPDQPGSDTTPSRPTLASDLTSSTRPWLENMRLMPESGFRRFELRCQGLGAEQPAAQQQRRRQRGNHHQEQEGSQRQGRVKELARQLRHDECVLSRAMAGLNCRPPRTIFDRVCPRLLAIIHRAVHPGHQHDERRQLARLHDLAVFTCLLQPLWRRWLLSVPDRFLQPSLNSPVGEARLSHLQDGLS